ncbi:tRNAHis guanylyltransferase [Testicularia cyperi]|uniref:tRNA(His) guanylyltransferase n=1 Tax=Testicularia cyperi TaxID=1882483 RepID=A0A317XWE6_9BASI|nr:tRNAHis guanylyltransferase [Testicularia cyperi]
MAGTKFAYVRNFELPDVVIPSTYMVVRIDGKGFHKFSKAHRFNKPNDPKALELMNESARYVMQSLKGQIALAFGESDEYSFLLRKNCTLYSRRVSKITTHIVSLFTSAYLFNWPRFFPDSQLQYPPSFDGRLVVYPDQQIVRDYFAWRQADTHINNLYNTTFWALVLQGGLSELEATKKLEGTFSADKHEILFSRFGINYDQLEAIFRKGTTLVWTPPVHASTPNSKESSPIAVAVAASATSNSDDDNSRMQMQTEQPVLVNPKDEKLRLKIERKRADNLAKKQDKLDKKTKLSTLRTLHCDIIGEEFWGPASNTIASAPEATPLGQTASSSISAPADTGNENSDSPWTDPARLECTGLGMSVFLD